MTHAQREQLRTKLRAAVLAYRRGWQEEDLLDAIDAVMADQAGPGR